MENKINYYKVIDGLNFDSVLLNMADDLIKGQGDGRISIDDSNKLLTKIFDGGTITKVECRTILYILKNENVGVGKDSIKLHMLKKRPERIPGRIDISALSLIHKALYTQYKI